MTTLSTLNETLNTAADDRYLIRQNGIDYIQTRETLSAALSNARWVDNVDYLTGSRTIGSDGKDYKAVQPTGPSTTVQDPTTDVSETYWGEVSTISLEDFDNSLVTSGYQKLPNGLILQWGVQSPVSNGTTETRNFPIVFPNAVFTVNGSVGPSTSTNLMLAIETLNLQQFKFETSGTGGSSDVHWFAIGH